MTGGFFYGWGWLHARAMPANEAGRILGTRLRATQQEHDSGHHPTQRVKTDTVASETPPRANIGRETDR